MFLKFGYFLGIVFLMYFFFYGINQNNYLVLSADKPLEKNSLKECLNNNTESSEKASTITKWIVDNCNDSNKLFDQKFTKSKTKWLGNDEVRYFNYIVQAGDTLYAIAKKYKTSPAQIIDDNNLDDDKLVVGKVLKIIDLKKNVNKQNTEIVESSKYDNVKNNYKDVDDFDGNHIFYKVGKGENLAFVANKFEMEIEELKTINNLTTDIIYPDQILQVKYKVEPIEVTKLNFMWPIVGRVISSFGLKERGEKNEGINIQAKIGADVKATEEGVVTYVGDQIKSFGVIILIQHDNNWISAYAYLKESKVKKGDYVKRGQNIAKIGMVREIGIPQLHFELRKNIESVNPLLYLNSHR